MEEATELELSLLSGFMHDRYLLGRATEVGFRSELMPHALGRNLSRILVEISEQKDIALEPLVVRGMLVERGLMTPEMRKFYESVVATPEPEAAQVIAYVDLLKARTSRLRLVEIGTRISNYLEDRADGADVVEFVGTLIPSLMEIQRQRLARSSLTAAEVAAKLVKEITAGQMGSLLGYSISPFDRLNDVLSGMRRGFYYGLAGAPRRGKTNLALEMAATVAATHKIPVLYYSWEQTNRILIARLLAREVLINPARLLSSESTNPAVQERLRDVWAKMEPRLGNLFILEAGRLDTVERIKARAHNAMHTFQTDECAIFIDYLQRVPLDEQIQDDKARTDMISAKLADLSLELDCPVFAISPLDKEGCRMDERPGEEASQFDRPTMHHSVGSGDLEYDLDVAMVLVKDWVATKNLDDLLKNEAKACRGDLDSLPRIDILNLHLDKNRDAPDNVANTIQFAFFISLNKFVEIGYKTDEQFTTGFRDFAKMQAIVEQLRQGGLLTAV